MKFIHIADVHLGMKPDNGMSWSEDRHREIKETFLKVLEICNKDEIDFLFIAGDLFHKQPLMRELKEINYAFSKLKGTKVIMIAGNHDYMSERSHYTNFPWCEQVFMMQGEKMESIYFPELDTQVYGFSYHQRDIMEQRYTNIVIEEKNRINILVAHGGDEKNIPIDKKNLKQLGFDYVAMGHIHKPEFITSQIAYAGSLEPLDKNETGKHGYIYGEIYKDTQDRNTQYEYTQDLNKKDKYTQELNKQDESIDIHRKTQELSSIHFVPFASREYIPLEIEVEPTMTSGEINDYAKNLIVQLGVHNIYKLILIGLKDPDIIIEEHLLYNVGNVIQIVDETVPDYDFGALYYENKENIIGMYIDEIRHCGENDDMADKALYYGIEALLRAKE